MKRCTTALSLLIGCLVFLAFDSGGSLAAGVTIYVDIDAAGANNGSSWEDAFTDLQPALAAAVAGDEIWVAAGTYKPTVEHGGSGNRYKSFQMKNGVALYGGFDPSVGDIAFGDRDWGANLTILSGDIGIEGDTSDNCYHVFHHPDGISLNSTAILDGFTIVGGNANGASSSRADDGGGMFNYSSSPSLSNCIFSGNRADFGGGMYNDTGSSPTLTGCTFSGNSAVYGGGMWNNSYSATPTSPALTHCTFSGNSADYGGGMYNYRASPTLTDCTFSGNSATSGGGMFNDASSPALTACTFSGNSADYGGGMFNRQLSSPTLTGCTFSSNPADYGGGMYNTDRSSPTLTGCVLSGNSAEYQGGGMYDEGFSSPVLTSCTISGNSASQGGGMVNWRFCSPVLTNCTFSGNSAGADGGGMYNFNDSSPVLTNCTFEGNSAARGGGMYNSSRCLPVLTNCILWGDTPREISNEDLASAPVVTYSDIQGGYSGVSNINADPRLVDPDNGNFHLGACSPCVDRGNNSAPNLPDFDFEGDARVLDGDGDGTAIVDMGVDEVAVAGTCSRLYLPVVLKGY